MEEKGFDLYASLPLLSTYLGHKGIVETEYYLKLVQEDANESIEKANSYLSNLYTKNEVD